MIRYIVEKKAEGDKWTKVGEVPSFEMTVDSLKEGKNYEFRVAAENKAGVGPWSEIIPRFKEAVDGKPKFLKPLVDVEVIQPEEIVLECQVNPDALETAKVTWFDKNNKEIKPGQKYFTGQVADTLTLKVAPSKIDEDTGTYKVVVANNKGKIESVCKVTVKAAPKVEPEAKFKEGQPVTFKAGLPMALSATVTGFPKPEVTWFFTGDQPGDEVIALKHGGDVTIAQDKTVNKLTLKKEVKSGKFKVVAKNELGEDSAEFPVIVKGYLIKFNSNHRSK